MKKIIVLGLLISIGVGLSSCSKNEMLEEIIKKEDNTLVIVNNSDELFEKRADKDMEKIADEVDPFSVSYAHELETTFAMKRDSKKIIAKTKKENIELEVGTARGNKVALAQDGVYKVIEPYKVSKDGSTVVILNSKNELYKIDSKGEFKIIETIKADYDYNTGANIKISDNGEYVYFINKFNILKVMKNDWKESKVIDEEVSYFNISKEGKIVSYRKLDAAENFIVNIENNSKKKEGDEGSDVELQDDGGYEIQRNYNEMTGTKNITYVDRQGGRHELAGDIFVGNSIGIGCKRVGDILYYGEYEKVEPYESKYIVKKYDLNTKREEVVHDAGVDFAVNGESIYFIENGKYLKLEDESVKLLDEETEDAPGWYKLMQNGDSAIYLSRDGKLFINDEKIEENIINVVSSNGDIAYIDNLGKVKVMDIKTRKIENELAKGDIYKVIMYGQELLWKSEGASINHMY